MNTPLKHDGPLAGGPSATTTEELIVQYLDGELRRKELESVLFSRLAESEDARVMLHEHLVLRGAIRATAGDEQYMLSDALDRKTRARIEQALKFTENAPAIATNPAQRRTARWVLRPSLAMLGLLLAIGTTWFVTHSSDKGTTVVTAPARIAQAPAQQQSVVRIAEAPKSEIAMTSSAKPESLQRKSAVAKATPVANAISQPVESHDIAQAQKPEQKSEELNASDLMASKRFAKILNATAKHEVVITGHDRL